MGLTFKQIRRSDEKISKLEDAAVESSQSQAHEEKTQKQKQVKKSFSDLEDNTNYSVFCTTGILDERRVRRGDRKII